MKSGKNYLQSHKYRYLCIFLYEKYDYVNDMYIDNLINYLKPYMFIYIYTLDSKVKRYGTGTIEN